MMGTQVVMLFFFAGLGFAGGLAHFTVLKRAVAVLLRGGPPAALALYLLRFPLTALTLGLSVTGGGVSMLAALAGFLVARVAALRQQSGACP